jgi:hypothetical protein
MSEPIITGVFTLLGALLGGIISYLGSRNERKIELLKSRVNLLSKQVISYWNLEKLYSDEIGQLLSRPSRTVLQEYRDKIESMDLERPTMTEKEAKRILTKNS